ncbi:hypothetical protein ABBQ32_008906 [Trebouxia sp. C0010 RCD-2024]
MDGSPLYREVLAPSIEILQRLEADNQLNDSEKYALGHLCNWLQEVSEANSIDDADLDESALSYLKSYKESYSRKKTLPADSGGVIGSSRRVILNFPIMCDRLHKRRLRLVLLVFIAVQLQLGQVLCLQTQSLRTCSLDGEAAPPVEEVSQVICSTIHFCSCMACPHLSFP